MEFFGEDFHKYTIFPVAGVLTLGTAPAMVAFAILLTMELAGQLLNLVV